MTLFDYFVYVFAFLGVLLVAVVALGGVLAWVERYKEGFRYKAGDKVTVSHGHPLLRNWRLTHHVVVARFNSWYGRRNYLITGPEYLEGTSPEEVYPVELRREGELHGGWH